MKKNKKALLGMFMAMVLSMGVLTGSSCLKSENTCLQQISVCTAANGATSEGVTSGVNYGVSAVAATAASGFYSAAIVAGCTGAGAPVAIANGILGGICTL